MRVNHLSLFSPFLLVNYKNADKTENQLLGSRTEVNFTARGRMFKRIGRVLSKPLVEGFVWEGLGLSAFFTGLFAFVFNNSWNSITKGGLVGIGALATLLGAVLKHQANRIIEDRTIF